MLKYRLPIANVIHVEAATQYELARAFIRPQEFYESGFKEIRGQFHHSVETIAKVYKAHDVPFDYFSKWNGFNLPGHVYNQWLAQHRPCGLSSIEARLQAAVSEAVDDGLDARHYYLIGTWRPEEIRHELAHAMFYLDTDYRQACLELIESLRARNYDTYRALGDFLKQRGYAESVIADEIQAYLCEADIKYWVCKMGAGQGLMTYAEGQPFASLASVYLEKHGYSPSPGGAK